MITLSGYDIISQIDESINSTVYRGICLSNQQKVILKVLKKNYPTSDSLIRYKQEYELTKSLNLDSIIKAYSLQEYENKLIMILEDFGGESLNILQHNYCFYFLESLKISIRIVQALEQLHKANLIHKDINSNNIIFNYKTEQLKIIDLGIATRLTRENPILKEPQILEGTLAYMSPEQTGRLNLSLDYRTDFYSLGVTLYELFTGKLPFETEDSLELIYCHLAKQPLSPSQINPLIPQPISDIIMKLMAKNPDERYQSTWGLKADLESCLKQFTSTQKIDYFPMAIQDISDKFNIPEKLYGREKEIQLLLDNFNYILEQEIKDIHGGREKDFLKQSNDDLVKGIIDHNNHDNLSSIEPTSQYSKIIFIKGYSGTGKSVLVQEIYKSITDKKGYLITGKFEQFQQNIPYSAIVSALRQLLKQFLTETKENLDKLRRKILNVLGLNGQVIIDVIPELELIIGKQLPVAEIGIKESENRFKLLFQKFINCCCSKEHPLVLFLDDLQWADLATLELIKLLINNREINYLLIIVAYRDQEVQENHPVNKLLNYFQNNQQVFNQIDLGNLTLENIYDLMSDTLKCEVNKIKYLAELVYNKTLGNPFFVKQFLVNLYQKKLIYFNYKKRLWQWKIKKIINQNMTDNVVELMVNEVNLLTPSTQCNLKYSACFGASFTLSNLSLIKETLPTHIFPDLVTAINAGLILPLTTLNENLIIEKYKFKHDRIQQAFYNLIPEEDKAKIHLKIGLLLLENTPENELDNNIFDILKHLNQGRELIKEITLREKLAQLNLTGGIKAKNTIAYSVAKIYLKIAIELLRDNCWQNQYDLTLNLYTTMVEVAYLNGDVEEMTQKTHSVLTNATSILDKVKVYKILIAVETSHSNLLSAIDIGRQALQELGFDLPTRENNDILTKLETQLEGKNIEDFKNLPPMGDKKVKAVMDILWRLYSPIFQGMPELLPFLGEMMVSLSLQYGNASVSPVGYVIYGMVLCTFFEEVEKGYRFGKLALELTENYLNYQYKGIIGQIFATCIQPRQKVMRATLPIYQQSIKISLETGDFLTAGYTILVYDFTLFFSGVELDYLQREINNYYSLLLELKQDSAKIYVDMVQQTIDNLLEKKVQPNYLTGNFYDEMKMFPQHRQQQELTALAQAYTYKIILAYSFHNYSSALDYLVEGESYLGGVSSLIFFPVYHFYSALTYLALYPSVTQKKSESVEVSPSLIIRGEVITQEKIWEKIIHHQGIVAQWAKTAPMNHQHKYDLIEAEKERVLGSKGKAIEFYELALDNGKKNQYLQELALIKELYAQFYLQWGKEKLGYFYLRESHYDYSLWGAKAKIEDLEQKYPQLFEVVSKEITSSGIISQTARNTNSKAIFDLQSIMKASQAITSEIVFGNLLQTLMKILLENAGGTKGCLLLHQPTSEGEIGNFVVSVYCDNERVTIFYEKPVRETLPESILYYTARTKETILLDRDKDNNTKNEDYCYDKFAQDNYIKTYQPLSLLCYPLINQGKLMGVVYLENNLTSGVFTVERIELLKLLSQQAVIAIHNSQLYAHVKEKEEQLREFLEAVPVGIAILDSKGSPYYVNQQAKILLGKGVVPNVTSDKISEVYQNYIAGTNNIYPNDQLPIIKALKGQMSTCEDIEIHQKDRVILLEVWGTPIYDNFGNVEYAMAAFQDITQRKQAEKLLSEYNRILEQQVNDRTLELQKLNQELLNLANLDGLTKIANRRRFDDYLAIEWQRHLRQKEFLALILIDIDYFKLYNDYYQHQKGDDCLITVAQNIAKIPKRSGDLVARYGGEEFVVILPNTNTEGALIVAEEIRQTIVNLQIPHVRSKIFPYVTLSLGVASMIPDSNFTPSQLIYQADGALYLSKEKGRNQVNVYN
ncbi:diguanylate cyclase domain-containing protein [Geminocystis herdmanii]|uniref:diguanylate cyclase domain-containing protein n=1 Tax=Geminocystis herdmanii TaxID=669359 RepID=UPI00034515D9|nr:diguanylate cyclase [Geminocystis herdmanii]